MERVSGKNRQTIKMKISIKQAYKVVLVDLKANQKWCKDYSMGCYTCAVGRMIEDLECYTDLMFRKDKISKKWIGNRRNNYWFSVAG